MKCIYCGEEIYYKEHACVEEIQSKDSEISELKRQLDKAIDEMSKAVLFYCKYCDRWSGETHNDKCGFLCKSAIRKYLEDKDD